MSFLSESAALRHLVLVFTSILQCLTIFLPSWRVSEKILCHFLSSFAWNEMVLLIFQPHCAFAFTSSNANKRKKSHPPCFFYPLIPFLHFAFSFFPPPFLLSLCALNRNETYPSCQVVFVTLCQVALFRVK